MANDIEIIFQLETDNIDQVEMCLKAKLKPTIYRSYKEIYKIDYNLLKEIIKSCDAEIRLTNDKINQTGGNFSIKEPLYLLFSKA